jgi:hypothetical protein
MTKLVLSVHVLAAIVIIGPLAVATSLFPSAVRRAARGDGTTATARTWHTTTRGYAVAAVVVPAFGMATAGRMNVITSPWLIASTILVVAAAVVLAVVILPQQRRVLAVVEAGPPPGAGGLPGIGRITVAAGLFNLIWAVVTVLMIVRPGSTTGA